ncbi:MAG: TerB family tellurite resistance protein [Opitutales bacterium]|nr:TerB family tellurite resistance protein [Opitutales bacterium]
MVVKKRAMYNSNALFMVIGKILGGIIGLAAAGPWGAAAGVAVGHVLFDAQGAKAQRPSNSENRARFILHTASACAKIAKISGRVEREEIDEIERIFAELGVGGELRREAIAIFRSAKNDPRSIAETASIFAAEFPQSSFRMDYIAILARICAAKGSILPVEISALETAASVCGVPPQALRRIIETFLQGRPRGYGPPPPPRADGSAALKDAYAVLEIEEFAPFEKVKSAYRKKCKELHPDVLKSKGLGEYATKLLENELRRVNEAYKLIEKHSK